MNIDWSKLITKAMKEKAAADQAVTDIANKIASLRAAADYAIAPLQDAVDIDDATDAEIALLKAWKKYRVALIRLPEQPGYPAAINWPAIPA
ncbi:tail fiber assembly protein [Pseudomonas cichorii]|uniref:tail fiber assembly protein n=1 Tax=Pseudomonas cichorii TaxID=36746 RepID=UPI0019105941|nr:tail fiber assembly protein [Pseudomonas cichorii]GFM89833.1 tail fiber assembly protein [Pseudomonas cichorii]